MPAMKYWDGTQWVFSGGSVEGLAAPWNVVTPSSGSYFSAQFYTTTTNGNLTLDRLTFAPIWIPTAMSVDRIVIRTAGGTASSAARLGIYASNGAGGSPGTLVIDGGTVATTSGNSTHSLTIASTALSAGLYYIAVVGQTAAPSLVLAASTLSRSFGSSSADTGWVDYTWTQAGVSGALPSTATPVSTGAVTYPACGLRRA